MTTGDDRPNQSRSKHPLARRLRIAAVFVILLGVIGAETLYWFETRSADRAEDPAMMGNEKAQTRQLEVLYGKSNVALQEWVEEVKQRPGEQAAIVIGFAALLAGGCVYFASWLDHGGNES